ncbi:hypothetical protein [Stenotrophomonas nematodicola]|uniref:Uncharacterized protein n=1 Tax=Stenotrophomonas nematodicola TaxID=2656746 RepID=A0ABW7CY09_9GAMM
MMATAYGKSANGEPVMVRALDGGLASSWEPLWERLSNFDLSAVLEDGRLQAEFLNKGTGKVAAGGRLICASLHRDHAYL